MTEFIDLCFSSVNLPFTILLICVFAYWILLLLGAIGLDALDIDLDLDGDGEPNIEAGGVVFGILKFFNLGEVPVMVLLSFVSFNLWALTLLTSYYLTPDAAGWVAIAWIVPNTLAALFLAKFMTTPLKEVFRRMKAGIAAPTKIVGQTCVVTTSEVTPKFGEAEMHQQGPSLILHVRAKEGVQLHKGDKAYIVAHNEEDGTYVVVPFEESKQDD